MQLIRRKIILNSYSINNFIIKRNVNASASVSVNDAQPKSFKEIPTPSSLPFIGQRHHFLPGQMLSNLKTMHQTLYKRYGPISRVDLAGKSMVMLYDPEAVAAILKGEDLSPERPGLDSMVYFRKHYNKTLEQSKEISGLVSDSGENWRKLRTIVNPVLLHKNIVQRYRTQLEDVAKDMVARMRKLRDDNKLNEKFASEMNLWALESIGVVALGGRLNCLTQDLPDSSPQKRLIQNAHDVHRIINVQEYKPSLWKYFASKKFKQAMKIYAEQEELTRYFVQKARKELESKTCKQDDEEKSVLEKLLDIDEKIAVIMASDVLFGGIDTVANTISATFYLLAANQDKQDKLREAIENGDQKYLRACYKESLRLMPIGGNMRLTTKEHNILGYKIPKDTFIYFGFQQMSLRADQFPRPNEYIPERWIEEGPLSHKNAHPFAFNPFGYGIRMCPGVRIVELEVETFLTEAIKNFKLEWSGPPPEVVAATINYVKGPFNFTFKDI